ncbi:MAG: tRNA pseudouridine(38-40) synthase TruA, partial [Methanomicrobiales archaeon]|nr:tRNA pseudouridine(38-40) synthase TruA [Methanomicrobiales archaeon]
FLGTRDFSGYARPDGRNPVRTVLSTSVSTEEDGICVFEVTAESFLWHQVRRMAAALLLVGTGETPESSIEKGFDPGGLRKPCAASPSGLVLWDVDCGIKFLPMEYPPKAGAYLAREEEHHAVMRKICKGLECEFPDSKP